jgi:CRP/FNR family transcriptional regulator
MHTRPAIWTSTQHSMHAPKFPYRHRLEYVAMPLSSSTPGQTGAGLPDDAGEIIDVPAGLKLFGPGAPCERFVLVLSGSVRVQTLSPGGREIVLYRVQPGQACIMTAACLMAGAAYAAEGIAESACRLQVLARTEFEQRMAESGQFRRFVLEVCGTRLVQLMLLFEEVTFERIDVRLAAHLLRNGNDALDATHQAIALELGTAREVVSRHLKEFERRGWVDIQRGRIGIRDRTALRALTASVTKSQTRASASGSMVLS